VGKGEGERGHPCNHNVLKFENGRRVEISALPGTGRPFFPGEGVHSRGRRKGFLITHLNCVHNCSMSLQSRVHVPGGRREEGGGRCLLQRK
jgi:hypothetical protein